jgi:hypothetical protein
MQGTHGWARVLKYYKANPITADGGVNVIYETHIYNHAGDFNKLLTDPALVLPVIIGEMGPAELDGEGQLQVRRQSDTLFGCCSSSLCMLTAGAHCTNVRTVPS